MVFAEVGLAFEALDEEPRQERLQRLQHFQVGILVVVATDADAVRLPDELLTSMGVVEIRSRGSGSFGLLSKTAL
ncbi:hypothetical protein G1H11_15720 [Phytoactinopolyspora alkaliphila]|uniref:Uncharacterized protein n=1 Tax=Phytoactinopolyspora alkaliphila TaxID=1783498 RepID=A0A6N9YP83_9ACTN|nr:hypothetical protein [Phytoactinopolyspora alkaliphila]NED96757.1 hypothetical protein [Phytoactinopolyspora alkaliphila]